MKLPEGIRWRIYHLILPLAHGRSDAPRDSSGPRRYDILGVPVDAVDMAQALSFIEGQLAECQGAPIYILAVNPEKVFAIKKDQFLASFFEKAGLLLPDGIGVVAALRFLYGARVDRVPGADLMQAICGLSAERGYKVFLYGAKEEVNAGSAVELARR